MFGTIQHRFVFKHKWNRQQQLKSAVQGCQQELAGSPSITAQRRHQHVRVDNKASRHELMILHAISLVK